MFWNRIVATASPSPILTLEEAKTQLRVVHTDDDTLIERLVMAATAFIEGPRGIGVALSAQEWRLSLDAFPNGPIRIDLEPVTSVVSIEWTDPNGDAQAMTGDDVLFDPDARPALIFPVGLWPSTKFMPGAVKVTVEAGHGDDLPADLKQAALMILSHLYENREAVSATDLKVVPMAVESILSRHRVVSFG